VFARALLLSPATLASPKRNEAPPPLPVAYLRDAGRGSAPGQFSDPRAVAVGADGSVYVADTGNHRVQVFAADGRLTAVFGEHGATPGTFDEPSALAIDADGKLHVVDTWNNRVQKVAPTAPLALYAPPEGFFDRAASPSPVSRSTSPTPAIIVEIFDSGGCTAAVSHGRGKPVNCALRRHRGDRGTSGSSMPAIGCRFFAPDGSVLALDARAELPETESGRLSAADGGR
jgi:hypothetical protein